MNEPQRIDGLLEVSAVEAGRGFASRKFVLALLVVLVSTGLLWSGKLDAARWVEAVTWAVGLYMLGNGASSWATVWGRR